MIKAIELRIGNYINQVNNVRIVQVYGVVNDRIYYSLNASMPDKSFKPIPLTPEWLEVCGGVKTIGTPFYEIDLKQNIGQIAINPNNGMVWLKHHRNENSRLNPMSGEKYYLHQLQNLFFSLTGRELEINLPAQAL